MPVERLPRRRSPSRPLRCPPGRRAVPGTLRAPGPDRRPEGPGSSRPVQGKPSPNPEAASGPRPCLQLAAECRYALAHAEDPLAVRRLRVLRGAAAIVFDLDGHVAEIGRATSELQSRENLV